MKIAKRTSAMLAALAVSTATATIAIAPAVGQATAGEAVAARQQNFKAMGEAFKIINDEMRSGQPDAARLRAAADRLNRLSARLADWFAPGSGMGSGLRTAAKDDIWRNPQRFSGQVSNFRGEVSGLVRAVAEGDESEIRSLQMRVGRSCSSCHSDFRAR